MNNKSAEFEIIKPPAGFSIDIEELWRYRELVYIFAWRDIISKYKQTILGFIWAIIQPLSMIVLFTFFFSGTLKISTDSIPPPVFYFSGLLIWNFYNTAITKTANSIVVNKNIIQKIYFPRIILPSAHVAAAFFDFLVAFSIFLVLIVGYEFMNPDFEVNYINFLFYPLAFLMVIFGSFGIGCILAALNVKFRDVNLVIGFITQFLFFLTPVIYPVSVFKSNMAAYLLAINPAVGAINLMRAPFVDTAFPVGIVVVSALSSFFIFIIGAYLFKKAEYYFADLV